jgi:hypothetical protein
MTHQDFIAAWLGSKSELEVSAKTGLDTHKIANIGGHLRHRGVLLPKMPKHIPERGKNTTFSDKLDVQALNKFILER